MSYPTTTPSHSLVSAEDRGEEAPTAPALIGELVTSLDDPEAGATTAEYGIVMLAAVGFAGLLVVILKSDEVRELLLGIVRNALSTGA
ncbi:DUF4244 domain-containing protein [Rothia sp. P100]|uniref:DUF4244 domain-containing protein n=1 Tax=Rothia sp. P100 TaxID=2939578 RepID=UPI00203E8904|nr:DUF4244 domain-containing protein [Rothia sp. P100]MCM3509790.1 DUF4244 domain-containing protein [Rothia sp. P100]